MWIMIRPFTSLHNVPLPYPVQQSHLARQQIHWLLREPKIRYRVKKKTATGPYPGPDEFSSHKISSFEVQIDIIVFSQAFH